MLRSIKSDFESKSYVHKAREVSRQSASLMDEIKRTLSLENKRAALAIRSVLETGKTVRIRATSRAAMSELYTSQDVIMKIARRAGFDGVRFTV